MSYLNGVVVREAIALKATIDADNPLIGPDEMQLSYDSLSGINYRGVRARVGPGNWLDLEDIFSTAGSYKIPKTGTMISDYVYVYTILASDILALGAEIAVSQILVNGQQQGKANFSNFPVVAGDTITLTGLETISGTTSLNFTLQ